MLAKVAARMQATPIPTSLHRPTCLVFFAGDPCDRSIQQYNELLAERQQQQWDVSVAEPLRKQIADQQKIIAGQQGQIETLEKTIESQTMAALQREARQRASLDLLGAMIGIPLAFLVALVAFRRLARNPNASAGEPERAQSARASSF